MAACEVSVVIATHRREDLVVEAIESVLTQEDVDVEVVVVDDGGGSAKISVEGIGDPRVRYVARSENSGRRPGLVRNDGARIARGTFLHFLDDDDRLAGGALRILADAIVGARRAGMAFGRVVPFGDDEAVLTKERAYFATAAKNAKRLGNSRFRFAAQLMFKDTCLVNSACMVRRDVFAKIGGYDPEVAVIEDLDLFLRAGRTSGFVYVDHPVLHYRKGGPSITTDLRVIERSLGGFRRMYRKYRDDHGALEFYALKVATRLPDRIASLLGRRAR